MDGKLMIFVVFVFAASFSSITCGSDKIYIKDKLQLRPFDYQVEPTNLQQVVADALSRQYKNRQMLDVSRTSYRVVKAWRGLRNLFTKGVTRLFSSSFYRDAKTGRTLKEWLKNNYDVTKRYGFVVPFEDKSLLNGNDDNKMKRRRTKRGRRNDDDSDESSAERVQKSDEDDSEEDNVPKRRQNRRPSKPVVDLDSLFK